MSCEVTTWSAPAKLNLFLHIVGRRVDGYHLLQTCFQFLDWSDTVAISCRDDGRIVLPEPLPGVVPEADLTYRAAVALQQHTRCSLGAEIRVSKLLPMGGGLGGGSSDAATVLLALNEIWDLGCSVDDLAAIGLELGADVPVFVRQTAAWAEGVGEKLTAVSPREHWYIVVIPPVHVNTAKIFSDSALTRDTEITTIPAFLAGHGRNDCEAVVRRHYREVSEALDWLGEFAKAKLTGTGACVFAAFADEDVARKISEQCPFESVVTRGLNRSPIADELARYRAATKGKS